MDRIRWGILGCGDVTEIKSGPALQKAPRSDLVAVMRRNGAKAADYARRHGVSRHYDKAGDLIADPQVDAVYIATPPSTHKELAIQCLAAGKPVLVEKPMAVDLEECRAMKEAAVGGSLTIAYYRRALPRFEKLREIVRSGVLGKLHTVTVVQRQMPDKRPPEAWKLDPNVNGGGLFVDLQTHVLDWLAYVFGRPHSIAGDIRRLAETGAAEDTISYVIGFDGVTAVGTCCYAASENRELVTIEGDAGSVSMGFLRPCPITLMAGSTKKTIDLPDPPHVHQPFVQRLVAHYLDGAPSPCPPDAGMIATEIVDALYRSFRQEVSATV
ncbi:MAG: Gfo/Idh/MocA family oxidoreductase [Pseudomonadota bacterium]